MRSHRGGTRFARLWRTRRMMLRAALILISLSFLSLLGMLWSFSLDYADFPQEGVEGYLKSVSSPPSHGINAGGKENDEGKTPFQWALQRNSTLAPLSSAASLIPSADTLWFNNVETTEGDENLRTAAGVYRSNGVARIVLAGSAGLNTETDAPQSPHLIASNVSWRAYARYMKLHANAGDVHAGENTADTRRDLSKMFIRPLKHVEVQLLSQRMSRNVWAASEQGLGAIVGVVPFESSLLASADELLVELHLRAEDQINANPDPSRLLSLAATFAGDKGDVRGRKVLRIDTQRNLSKVRTPLVELKSAHRPADIMIDTAKSIDTSSTTTTLTWRIGDADSNAPVTLDIQLDMVHPRQLASDDVTGDNDVDRRKSMVNEVYTDALQATVCSTRLVRLYGLSPLPLKQQQQKGDAKPDGIDGINSVSLNMSEGVEVMVGGRPISSPYTSIPGVVPLLYVELDTSDVPNQPSQSSTRHRTVGLLWLHSAPFILSTFTTASTQMCVRLRSTAGSTKVYLLPGPKPADVLRQYYTLTGFPTLPPRFFLGYHHGVRSATASTENAVRGLEASFLRLRVPLDSVWITNTAISTHDTPFTWNTTRFPDPVRFQSNLWYSGRRYVVARTVPTIPITYRSPLFLEGRRQNFFVTMSADKSIGWPTRSVDGAPSHVVDYNNPSARRWYGNMLKYRRYVGSTNHTFVRLQYAAPSVMASSVHSAALPGCALRELARVGDLLPMEVGHHGSFTHREVHQLLPVMFAQSVHEGMLRRTQYVRRALVLTESYYAGIQRYAVVLVESQLPCSGGPETQANAKDTEVVAAGAGKNVLAAAWSQLQLAVRQCVQLSTLGIPFNGANLGAGLTGEVLKELLQRPTEEPVKTEVDGDAQERMEEDSRGDANQTQQQQQTQVDEDTPAPTSPPAQPTTSHLREVDQLLMKWYQAGVFFPLMYTEENVGAPSEAQGLTNNGVTDAAGPWWMHLPVTATTKAVIHANLKVRYALVPFLYTVAYHVSEEGRSFLAPLDFAQSSSSPSSSVDISALPTCYALGDAMVVCPDTSGDRPHVTSSSSRQLGVGLFDLWTGVWDAPTTSNPREDAAAVSAQGALPLRWLTMTGRGTMPITAAAATSLPTPAPLAPAFLRPGHIVATQNVLWPSSSVTESNVTQDDAHTVHSTHMGANWTLTVALPPLPSRAALQPVLRLLAEGDVFWDEGSHNSQQRPPASRQGTSPLPINFPVIPREVHHCLLHLKCFYEVREDAAARMVVEVRQTSDTCAEALAELQSHWQEEPEGFAERLSRATEHRDARLHAREVEQNEKEDRGLHTKSNMGHLAEPFTEEDLAGLRLPRWAEEAARNELLHSHLLHRIRFLFQNKGDAALLADLGDAPTAPTVRVERQVVGAEATREKSVSGRIPVSRGSPSSHEILVDLSACEMSDKDTNTAAVGSLAATPLFGVATPADVKGKAMLRVPPTHTWRFVFPLQQKQW